jgi:hypothetical protein
MNAWPSAVSETVSSESTNAPIASPPPVCIIDVRPVASLPSVSAATQRAHKTWPLGSDGGRHRITHAHGPGYATVP